LFECSQDLRLLEPKRLQRFGRDGNCGGAIVDQKLLSWGATLVETKTMNQHIFNLQGTHR